MKDLSAHTRKSPQERITSLTNFANRLLSKDEVNYRELIYIMENACLYHSY